MMALEPLLVICVEPGEDQSYCAMLPDEMSLVCTVVSNQVTGFLESVKFADGIGVTVNRSSKNPLYIQP